MLDLLYGLAVTLVVPITAYHIVVGAASLITGWHLFSDRTPPVPARPASADFRTLPAPSP